jgi:hypothetical protein
MFCMVLSPRRRQFDPVEVLPSPEPLLPLEGIGWHIGRLVPAFCTNLSVQDLERSSNKDFSGATL